MMSEPIACNTIDMSHLTTNTNTMKKTNGTRMLFTLRRVKSRKPP